MPSDSKPTPRTTPTTFTRAFVPIPAHRPPPGSSLAIESSVTPTLPRAPAVVRPSGPQPRFRHLSTEEMADRRAKGLCYTCLEKFHRDHQSAMKGDYLLELDDEEEDTDQTTKVEVSLHALTDIRTNRTM